MTGRHRRTPDPWPRRRPEGGYRARLCRECSTAPATSQNGLCARCERADERQEER